MRDTTEKSHQFLCVLKTFQWTHVALYDTGKEELRRVLRKKEHCGLNRALALKTFSIVARATKQPNPVNC